MTGGAFEIRNNIMDRHIKEGQPVERRPSGALLEMRHITKHYPGVVALDDVPFTLRAGEIHALLGENGAGKSTLIKVLTGAETRDGGNISLNGKEIFPRTPLESQHLGISTVYQEVNLCPNLSVAENIYIGRAPRGTFGIDWGKINRDAHTLLQGFGIDIDATRKLSSYSVAIQQMVAIARAIDISAQVLVLDEPTSSLSAAEVEKLFDLMRMLKTKGLGIIFVTHFLDQVYEISDTITVLRNGQFVGTYPVGELPKRQLVGKMIGKEYSELESGLSGADLSGQEHELFMSVEEASSGSIGPVSLGIHKREVLGLCGLLGSGRTEIASMMFGAEKMNAAKVEREGAVFRLRDPLDAIRGGLAFCPEDRKADGVIGEMSVKDNIILALQSKRGTLRTISRVEAGKLADEYINKLAIKTSSPDQLIKNLSGGNQQKVILARWLATAPDLLILDEPTRGIDVGTKAEIQQIVIQLASEGMALLFISSEIDEMLRCCSRMLILRDKEIVGELAGEEISEQAVMHHIAGEEVTP
jgi:simple sugar transport system ATP-binding protein